jgi:hypothetical protein
MPALAVRGGTVRGRANEQGGVSTADAVAGVWAKYTKIKENPRSRRRHAFMAT